MDESEVSHLNLTLAHYCENLRLFVLYFIKSVENIEIFVNFIINLDTRKYF
jgi:hypothetical protein